MSDRTTQEFTKEDWISVGMEVNAASLEKRLVSNYLGQDITNVVVVSATLSPYQKVIQMAVLESYIKSVGYEIENMVIIDGDYKQNLAPFEYADIEVEPGKYIKVPERGYFFLSGDYDSVATQRTERRRLVVHMNEWGFRRSKMWVYAPKSEQERALQFLRGLVEYSKANNILRGKKINVDFSHVKITEPYTWDSVILPPDTKRELVKNIDLLLNNIETYKKNGMTFKRGLILKGVPGVGKTMLGKILCRNLKDTTFVWVTPGDVSEAAKVKTICELARDLSPTVLFLEDIDLYGAHRERTNKGILGELMNQLDGLIENEFVIVVATTNRADELEDAIRNRPGRFDRVIEIPKPDDDSRRQLFDLFLSKVKVKVSDKEKLLNSLVDVTKDFTGAHVKELVNSAIISAIDEKSLEADGTVVIKVEHFKENLDKVRAKKIEPGIGFSRTAPDDDDDVCEDFPETEF